MPDHVTLKILGAVGLFLFWQMMTNWSRMAEMSDSKMTLEAEVDSLKRKKDNLQLKIHDLEREKHRLELKVDRLDAQVRDLLPLTRNRKHLPSILFITPTARRPTQKADLVRLYQTLVHVPNLVWVVVEDAEDPSEFIDEILGRSKLHSAHLTARTPENRRLNESDPHWKLPRGVVQRNAALQWIRTNYRSLDKGVVYFGDDDNTYDWQLFDEMRSIDRVGVWPVGVVGGLLVEAPILNPNLSVKGFNAVWKPERPFPIDMAAFAVNVTLVLSNSNAGFSYEAPRGFQESLFLTSLGLKRTDIEPKGHFCSRVFVWHTRTAKAELHPAERKKFWTHEGLSVLEQDAVS